jgi:hypothetical protein
MLLGCVPVFSPRYKVGGSFPFPLESLASLLPAYSSPPEPESLEGFAFIACRKMTSVTEFTAISLIAFKN